MQKKHIKIFPRYGCMFFNQHDQTHLSAYLPLYHSFSIGNPENFSHPRLIWKGFEKYKAPLKKVQSIFKRGKSITFGMLIIGLSLMFIGCKSPTSNLTIEPITYDQLPGWEKEDFHLLWNNYRENCRQILKRIPDDIDHLPLRAETWQQVCQKVVDVPEKSPAEQRQFIMTHFTPHRLSTTQEKEGLFTGYFQPILKASRQRTSSFNHPVYRKPDDLIIIEDLGIFHKHLKGNRIAGRHIQGRLLPYETSDQIRAGSLSQKGYELAWVDDPIQLFFMHIQGSGVLEFSDGSRQYLSYAATNGHAYTAIGKILLERGELSRDSISMQSIVTWLQDHPDQHNHIFNANASYVFFQPSPIQGVIGALGTQLYPLRSLAVDRRYIPLGSLLWLDLDHPTDEERIQRLVVAQDVGGAIKGEIRGDLFWGEGDEAGHYAGLMKSRGTYYLLLPKELNNV